MLEQRNYSSETIIAIGANLNSRFGPPVEACEEALNRMCSNNIAVVRRSFWYESAPVPLSDQPWYVNGVVCVHTTLEAHALLQALHKIEADMGRVRAEINGPRVIDLDLIGFGTQIIVPEQPLDLCVPHPRLHERAFVLIPLRDVAPDWHHPVSGASVDQMIEALPGDQQIRRIGPADEPVVP